MNDLEYHYRDALVGRIIGLKATRIALEAGESGAGASIKELAHMLKGSGGTYGFPEITTAAAALEQAHEDELLERLDELLVFMEGVVVGRRRFIVDRDSQGPE